MIGLPAMRRVGTEVGRGRSGTRRSTALFRGALFHYDFDNGAGEWPPLAPLSKTNFPRLYTDARDG